jgi:hypothetical protein
MKIIAYTILYLWILWAAQPVIGQTSQPVPDTYGPVPQYSPTEIDQQAETWTATGMIEIIGLAGSLAATLWIFTRTKKLINRSDL